MMAIKIFIGLADRVRLTSTGPTFSLFAQGVGRTIKVTPALRAAYPCFLPLSLDPASSFRTIQVVQTTSRFMLTGKGIQVTYFTLVCPITMAVVSALDAPFIGAVLIIELTVFIRVAPGFRVPA